MKTAANPTENTNKLFYGDNLEILRHEIPSESVDLIYLDPPFNSHRNYNVLFREESGLESEAQITAFEDTWHWNKATAWTYEEILTTAPNEIATMISAMKTFIGTNQMMAYLVMMAARLVELHRVLKPTGSLYLHCDPTTSHYLKILLDTIFGAENYRNEITWKRTTAHSDAKKRFANVSDIILFYGKSQTAKFLPQYTTHDESYLEKFYRYDDNDGRGVYQLDNMASPNPRPNLMYEWLGFPYPPKGWRFQKETMQKLHDEGRIWYPQNGDGTFNYSNRPRIKRYLAEQEGSIITNVWVDINPLHASTAEMLGYPTQKPVALLERIIQASSNEGDVVLDPFCGCGTTIAAAQKLNRSWVGIDITHLAIALQKYRLRDAFKLAENKDYLVIGEPKDLESARKLATENRYQFQWWALSLVQAIPLGSSLGSKIGKKGADRGIDGVINFNEFAKDKLKKVLIQVKSGKVKSSDVRDLRGTIERENAAIGVFITLEKPSTQMITEASEAGFYQTYTETNKYPKLQVLTIEELLDGAEIKMPPRLHQNFKVAPRTTEKTKQVQLNLYDQ